MSQLTKSLRFDHAQRAWFNEVYVSKLYLPYYQESILKSRFVLTIRGKILLLASIGIIGMFLSATINGVINKAQNTDTLISNHSQKIVQLILAEVLQVEKFIHSGAQKNAVTFQEIHQHARDELLAFQSVIDNSDMLSIARRIDESDVKLAEMFSVIRGSISLIHEKRNELSIQSAAISKSVQNIISAINTEEIDFAMEGDLLPSGTAILRNEIKNILNIINNRRIIFQNLLLQGGGEEFSRENNLLRLETEKQVKNTQSILGSINNQDYHNIWKEIEISLRSISTLEDLVFSTWQGNQILVQELMTISEEAQEDSHKILEISQANITQRNKTGQATILITIGAILIGLIGVSIVIVRTILGPINRVVVWLKEVSEGDLTKRLDVLNNDELGKLTGYFNGFLDKLQDVIIQVKENSRVMDSSSSQLSELSMHMSEGTEETSKRSDMVAVATEEMGGNINSVAAAMEQSSTNVNIVAAAAEEMSSTIKDIAVNAEQGRLISEKAVTKTIEVSDKMESLGKAAFGIGKVLEVITEISEQVNLLALNATIEAARAGEDGKGFAVVANEIKELAKQTAEAAAEIKDKVENIQESTGSSVVGIKSTSETINAINEIVGLISIGVAEQSAATHEIATNIAQAAQGIQEVNENVQQTSLAVGDITKDITIVNNSSHGIAKDSTQVQVSAEKLSQIATQQNSIIDSFKV